MTEYLTVVRPHRLPVVVGVEVKVGDDEDVVLVGSALPSKLNPKIPLGLEHLLLVGPVDSRWDDSDTGNPKLVEIHNAEGPKKLANRPNRIGREDHVNWTVRELEKLVSAEDRAIVADYRASCVKTLSLSSQLNSSLHTGYDHTKPDNVARLDERFQVGIPLNVIFWLLSIWLIPKFWPF